MNFLGKETNIFSHVLVEMDHCVLSLSELLILLVYG